MTLSPLSTLIYSTNILENFQFRGSNDIPHPLTSTLPQNRCVVFIPSNPTPPDKPPLRSPLPQNSNSKYLRFAKIPSPSPHRMNP